MTKKLLLVFSILLLATLVAAAADFNGKWVYEVPGRGGAGPTQITLTLKAEGAALTGIVSRPGRDGKPSESPITDGKVDGNTATFKTTMQIGDTPTVAEFNGTLSGDEIKLKVTRPGPGGSPVTNEFTAKRSTN